MRRRMLIRLDAAEPEVREAAVEALGAVPQPDGTLRVEPRDIPDAWLVLQLEPTDAGTEVSIEGVSEFSIPFFAWALRPLVRISLRRYVRHAADTLRARAAGAPPPPPRRPVAALPDIAFDRAQATLLSTAAAATAAVTFGSALFGQNVDYVGERFGTGSAGLGVALAFTRVGVLLSLVATALADRLGRRRVIVVGVLGACVTSGLSALAPSLAAFTAAQVLNRGFVITTATVAGIAAVEEAPEGARAFATSMLALAGGFGFSLAVVALPLSDLSKDGWRLSYLFAAAALVFLPRMARNLEETRRFRHLEDSGIARGRFNEIFDRAYGRRFVLLGVVGFLSNVFNAPAAQFTNKYLADERGFSGIGITLFRAATGAVPGLLGLLAAGRLAEQRGRKPVAVVGLLVATATQMVFFVSSGGLLWAMAAVSVVGGACGGIALGTLAAELFPTEVRGTSNALLLVISVAGSATGLLVAGTLAEPLGGLGRAIALTGIGTLLATVALVPRLPESAARRLDDVSPSESSKPSESSEPAREP